MPARKVMAMLSCEDLVPWGERVAWLNDPDGNLVMLTEERQPAAAGG